MKNRDQGSKTEDEKCRRILAEGKTLEANLERVWQDCHVITLSSSQLLQITLNIEEEKLKLFGDLRTSRLKLSCSFSERISTICESRDAIFPSPAYPDLRSPIPGFKSDQ